MSRRSAIIAVFSFCILMAGCAKADKRVSKANMAKIKPGMTIDEVDAILGPGEDNVGEEGMGGAAGGIVSGGLSSGPSTPALRWRRYGNDYTHIQVCFDRAGKVHSGDPFIKEKGLK